MTNYKATPEQWDDCGAFASDTRACILELRARIEALEAGTTCPHIVTSDEGTSYCRLAEQTAARRPKPPSLAEEALMTLNDMDLGPQDEPKAVLIRRALEALQELEGDT